MAEQKKYGCGVLMLGTLIVILFVAVFKPEVSHSPVASFEQAPRPLDPAQQLVEDVRFLSEAEQRLRENAQRLTRYYATPEQLQVAASDSLRASLVVAFHRSSELLGAKEASRKAERLLSQIQRQARELYASALEETFVKNGMDVDVSASGREGDLLRINYVLMSQPLVYKLQNEMRLHEAAKPLGFRKIIYTNGLESSIGRTWEIDLRS